MFYFSSDDLEIAGASPETLVKVDNQTAYTFPLAGTRPRGKDERRIRSWKPICFPMKRSWQSTTCWWISDEMILGGSAGSER